MGVLVPVGVKYGALQQTGRTTEERKEDWQSRRKTAVTHALEPKLYIHYMKSKWNSLRGNFHTYIYIYAERKNILQTLPVLVEVQNSFVEVVWQKQEKGAVPDRRQPEEQTMFNKNNNKWYDPKRKLKGHLLLLLVMGSHLCQSRGRGGVWDRRRSRYRLWWLVHFTFFCGSALGWRGVASLSEKQRTVIFFFFF